MPRRDFVDRAARAGPIVGERQQFANIVEPETQIARTADERQPLAARRLLCALALAALVLRQARGDTAGEVVRSILLGDVAMTALMVGSAEAVRGGVMFAAAGVRGVPGGATVN